MCGTNDIPWSDDMDEQLPWPPPATPAASPPEPGSAAGGGRRRRRALAVGLVAAALGVGGVVAAGQFAEADEPSSPPESTPPSPDDVLGGLPAWDLGAFGAIGECLAGELGVDPSAGGMPDLGRLGELTPEEITAAWEACRSELPDDVESTIDDVTECLGDMVDELPAGDVPAGDVEHGAGAGGVTVVTPDELSMLQFGDGDGSVTITKSGDEYTIESSGDVTETDLGRLDELVDDVQGALERCDITLPFDLGGLDLHELLPAD